MNRKKAFLSCLLLLILLTTGCASAPVFKSSQRAYNAPFDKVWAACLSSLSNHTIESADKKIRQIVTEPVASSGFNPVSNVDIQKVAIVRVSEHQPYTVQVKVEEVKRNSMTLVGTAMTNTRTDVSSDEGEEKRILEAIDSALR